MTNHFGTEATMERCHIVEPSGDHKYTIILLHGRGQSATQFEEEFFESQDSQDRFLTDIFPNARWLFPQAGLPYDASTDQDEWQWFDMQITQKPHEGEDEQLHAIKESCNTIVAILEHEAESVGYQNIILGGISQGCATAIHALLQADKQLAGFVGFFSWLPCPTQALASGDKATDAVKTPVLLEHCEDDDIIKVKFGKELHRKLLGIEMAVEWKSYKKGGHWINEPQGIDDFVEFVERCLYQ